MRKINIAALLLLIIAAGIYTSTVSCGGSSTTTRTDSTSTTTTTTSTPKTPLSPDLPYDVTIAKTDTDMATQIRHDFDLFSWQSFIALNWPVATGQVIGQFGDNTTVWGTWKKNYEVFQDNGQKPGPWDESKQAAAHTLTQVGKTPPDMTAIFQPFMTGPLIDQNGQYNRFEIAMNKEMFEYIDTNTLYNIEGQNNFKDTIRFQHGDNGKKQHGAIMVKASWKILGKGDDTARFHKLKATIHVAALPSKGIRDTTYEAWVGLVGLHIGTKTSISPQWIWSTFEQVDNAPDLNKAHDGHYNYYNKASGDAAMNLAPKQPWNPGLPGQTPSQVVRLIPIYSGTQALNDSFRKMIVAVNPNSVWQYYELVGTQWPVHPEQSNVGDPFPVYMANATLETYDQGTVKNGKVIQTPLVTSSCIDCHNRSTSWSGKTSDFTFLLKTAKALKK